jgi:hypothetical protein
MKIFTEKMVDDLKSKINNCNNPDDGQLLVSIPGIMKTCGYYIGRICAEWMGNDWCWQPYERETEYMNTLNEAERYLEYHSNNIDKSDETVYGEWL